MEIIENMVCEDSYEAHLKDRSMFQREFCRRLSAEPAFQGPKLDIGCGKGFPKGLDPLQGQMGIVDGVDPFPVVKDHAGLRNRWHGPLEEVDIADDSYDLAYAFNVVEHVEHATPFFKAVKRVLKPGGAFWAVTPHGKHPFCKCVKLVQSIQLKKTAVKAGADINDYPSYYNLNRVEDIAPAASEAGFTKLEMLYMPCMQWDRYVPKPLRFLPHLHDRFRGLKNKNATLVIAYRLE